MVYIIVQCNELSFQEIQVDFIFVCLSVHYHRIPGWKGTSGILWYKFSWQKHNPDKMAQHPVQLNLGNVLHWGIHHFPGKIIPKDRCLIMKIFLFFCLIGITPGGTCTCDSLARGSLHLFCSHPLNTRTWQ